ncbi:hypothetical protein ASD38_07430 [Caulobacter sp. Root487D2Y]|uniref:hypothetical protein n=1 Tax=Caulobacter sp. Root487D2Y TaxID=1736547 RepID=UPI00070019BF|nr:hypothetical protein [Caulobacter sp. Root487D2Y]KQY31164.1 hypothetical protein ASD38_07430 [Caulobacter sp. Root487D2Y]
MAPASSRDSLATTAAIALIAMCLVCFAHEGLGHGGACLALGGRVELLTASLFRCERTSPLIDAAGPLTNLLLGGLALILSARVPLSRPGPRLFLILVAAFSLFWEGGYLVQAMLLKDGDAYFAARDLLGEGPWWRAALGAAGAAIYGGALAASSRGLRALWPDLASARRVARAAWLAAVVGVAAAALLYQGAQASRGFHDAVSEIGLAALPLLLIPRGPSVASPDVSARLALSPATLALAAAVFVLFAATQGRGLGG